MNEENVADIVAEIEGPGMRATRMSDSQPA